MVAITKIKAKQPQPFLSPTSELAPTLAATSITAKTASPIISYLFLLRTNLYIS
jgi:hypothetical protein